MARGGELRGQLAVGPLLYGRVVVDEMSLSNSRIDLKINVGDSSGADAFLAMVYRTLDETRPHPTITRLALINTQIFLRDSRGNARHIPARC